MCQPSAGRMTSLVGRRRRHERRCTYPDSVRRVRPPKTTMPKTLTALPSSQYATDLELVSGKDLVLLLVPAASSEVCSRVGEGAAAAVFFVLLVFKHRTEGKEEEVGVRNSRSIRARCTAEESSVDGAFDWPFDLRHWRQTNGEAAVEIEVEVAVEKEAGDDSRDTTCWASLRMPILPMGGAGWKNAMASGSNRQCTNCLTTLNGPNRNEKNVATEEDRRDRTRRCSSQGKVSKSSGHGHDRLFWKWADWPQMVRTYLLST